MRNGRDGGGGGGGAFRVRKPGNGRQSGGMGESEDGVLPKPLGTCQTCSEEAVSYARRPEAEHIGALGGHIPLPKINIKKLRN